MTNRKTRQHIYPGKISTEQFKPQEKEKHNSCLRNGSKLEDKDVLFITDWKPEQLIREYVPERETVNT